MNFKNNIAVRLEPDILCGNLNTEYKNQATRTYSSDLKYIYPIFSIIEINLGNPIKNSLRHILNSKSRFID